MTDRPSNEMLPTSQYPGRTPTPRFAFAAWHLHRPRSRRQPPIMAVRRSICTHRSRGISPLVIPGRAKREPGIHGCCRHCEERKRRSNPYRITWNHGLLRGACHRARIRATRWLAMTGVTPTSPQQRAHLPPTSCSHVSCCAFSRLLLSSSRSLTRFAATPMASAAAL
jgi:hypothetical protein